jgi:cellulose synthase/poly-beta-1,6-N-acetylglucosamine synthase-like glycosyltransferase
MKKKTVTVGIPAHNEESNIANILNDILLQERKSFTIQNITVACDGCTDNTSKIVRSYTKKHKIIKVIDDGKRLGQAERLNNFFRSNKSDIFITFDADTKLANKYVIKNLVKKFDNDKIGVVGGHDKPFVPTNFVEKVAVNFIDLWYDIRINFNNGSNMHNLHGCVIAFSRECAKRVRLPISLVSSDVFIYYQAMELGFSFRFASDAQVFYHVPSTISDYFKQTARFMYANSETQKFFPNIELSQSHIPFWMKIKVIFSAFIRDPIVIFFALLFQVLVRIYSRYKYRGVSAISPIWSTVTSTKNL